MEFTVTAPPTRRLPKSAAKASTSTYRPARAKFRLETNTAAHPGRTISSAEIDSVAGAIHVEERTTEAIDRVLRRIRDQRQIADRARSTPCARSPRRSRTRPRSGASIPISRTRTTFPSGSRASSVSPSTTSVTVAGIGAWAIAGTATSTDAANGQSQSAPHHADQRNPISTPSPTCSGVPAWSGTAAPPPSRSAESPVLSTGPTARELHRRWNRSAGPALIVRERCRDLRGRHDLTPEQPQGHGDQLDVGVGERQPNDHKRPRCTPGRRRSRTVRRLAEAPCDALREKAAGLRPTKTTAKRRGSRKLRAGNLPRRRAPLARVPGGYLRGVGLRKQSRLVELGRALHWIPKRNAPGAERVRDVVEDDCRHPAVSGKTLASSCRRPHLLPITRRPAYSSADAYETTRPCRWHSPPPRAGFSGCPLAAPRGSPQLPDHRVLRGDPDASLYGRSFACMYRAVSKNPLPAATRAS